MTTAIGFGSSKQGTEKAHGEPLGKDVLKAVKTAFGFDPEQSFVVPEDVRRAERRKGALSERWKAHRRPRPGARSPRR